MPQAIERSLATPITRLFLPAIRGPGFAMSFVVMAFLWSWSWRRAVLSAAVIAFENECGVGADETEAVRHHAVNVDVIHALAHDGHVGNGGIEGLDIGGFADETVVHHQQRVDRLVHAGGAERMAGKGLRGADRRRLV